MNSEIVFDHCVPGTESKSAQILVGTGVEVFFSKCSVYEKK